MIKVLHIPSWYPTRKNPLHSPFIHELIRGINTRSEIQTIVFDWHEQTNLFPMKNPVGAFKAWRAYSKQKAFEEREQDGIQTLHVPYLAMNINVFGSSAKPLTRKAIAEMDKLAAKNELPDIIHAHSGYPASVIARNLSEKYKIPFLVTEQIEFSAFTNRENRKIAYDESQVAFNQSACVVALSQKHASYIKSYATQARVEVISNLANENNFVPDENHRNEVFTFLSVARLAKGKGIDDLIFATKKLADLKLNFKLRIVGDGPLGDELKALSHEQGLDQYITFTGKKSREEVAIEHRQADCFVLPSHYESFGVVYIEALASGVPVIAAKNGGSEDIVGDELVGVLHEPGDIEALAKTMQEMLINQQKRSKSEIRAYFMDRFSVKSVASRYLHLYQEILGKAIRD